MQREGPGFRAVKSVQPGGDATVTGSATTFPPGQPVFGDAPEFGAEVETDGPATLRFGDGTHGRRPETGIVHNRVLRVLATS